LNIEICLEDQVLSTSFHHAELLANRLDDARELLLVFQLQFFFLLSGCMLEYFLNFFLCILSWIEGNSLISLGVSSCLPFTALGSSSLEIITRHR